MGQVIALQKLASMRGEDISGDKQETLAKRILGEGQGLVQVFPVEFGHFHVADDQHIVFAGRPIERFTGVQEDIDAQYQSHYLAFIQKIHATYPNAHVFCALGPMLEDPHLSEARTAINAVIAAMQTSGFSAIELVEFPTQDCGATGSGCGCDYHPSVKTHQLMAAQLVPVLRGVTGWTP